jgi:hypothetical protein
MKRQIKKLNTFNRKLQALSGRINNEIKYLTGLKDDEVLESELDDIDLLWDDLDQLCEDVIKYSVCNGI